MPIFVALDRLPISSGLTYTNIRAWEIQILLRYFKGNTEMYGDFSPRVRARYICAEYLNYWVEALDMHEAQKKRK